MPADIQPGSSLALSERKKKLIAQGAIYRAGIVVSRQEAQRNMHPQQWAKNAINHLSGNSLEAIENIFRSRVFNADNLKILLPVLTAGISFLANKAVLRRLLGSVVVAGLATAAAVILYRKFSAWRSRRNK